MILSGGYCPVTPPKVSAWRGARRDRRGRVRVVAGEAIAGAAELHQDRRYQDEPDHHVRRPQAAHVDDRHALREEQRRQHDGRGAGQRFVAVDPAEPLHGAHIVHREAQRKLRVPT